MARVHQFDGPFASETLLSKQDCVTRQSPHISKGHFTSCAECTLQETGATAVAVNLAEMVAMVYSMSREGLHHPVVGVSV